MHNACVQFVRRTFGLKVLVFKVILQHTPRWQNVHTTKYQKSPESAHGLSVPEFLGLFH